MQVFQNLRRVVETLKEEVKRRQANVRQESRDAYHFDVREDETPAVQERAEREAIEVTAAAPSMRELNANYRRVGLVKRLRDKDALRDAIVVNELLQKPIALRRRG